MSSTATRRALTGLWQHRLRDTTGDGCCSSSVFVMGAFAEMPGDVSRICGIIAHDLTRTHVPYYNDDAERTKGVYRQRIKNAWGHTEPVSSSTAPGTHGPARRAAAPTAQQCRRTRTTRTAVSFLTTPRRGTTSPPRRAQPLLPLFRSNPPPTKKGCKWPFLLIFYPPSPSFTQLHPFILLFSIFGSWRES